MFVNHPDKIKIWNKVPQWTFKKEKGSWIAKDIKIGSQHREGGWWMWGWRIVWVYEEQVCIKLANLAGAWLVDKERTRECWEKKELGV